MQLIAIKKNGKMYVTKEDQYGRREWYKHHRFNGEPPKPSKGSDEWIVVNGVLETIEYVRAAHPETIGYKLKPEFPETELTPAEVPKDFFGWSSAEGDKHGDIRGLYSDVVVDVPETITPIDFTIKILDEDCEPTKARYPTMTEFPFRLEAYPVSWYKYPCYIKGDDLYAVIRAYVKSHLPSHCKITSDYDFSLTVERILPIIHEETVSYDVGRGKRTKIERRSLREIKKTIISICTSGHTYGEVIQRVHAENYVDLEKKIERILESYGEVMAGESVVCPSCRGYGVVDKPRASKIA